MTRWATLSAALLERSGLKAMIERHHRGQAQGQRGWRGVLHGSRLSLAYPLLVAVLALVSAGTGLYPYGPVLVAAVLIAPERWRSTYLAASIGAATGATLLAQAVQWVGSQLIAQYFPGLEHSPQWLSAEQWVSAYGSVALAVVAALPLPQIPPLLILALAQTPPLLIGLAIFVGKLCKYGAYILAVQLALRALRRGLHK